MFVCCLNYIKKVIKNIFIYLFIVKNNFKMFDLYEH